jgi:hypothetical protein
MRYFLPLFLFISGCATVVIDADKKCVTIERRFIAPITYCNWLEMPIIPDKPVIPSPSERPRHFERKAL